MKKNRTEQTENFFYSKQYRICLQLLISFLAMFATKASIADSLEDGQTVNGQYSNAAGMRTYSLFLPANLSLKSGLLVVLHGCFLTADQMSKGTNFNIQATAKGFAVLYPEQTSTDNPWKCWNWFKPENQHRNQGELSIIAGMTQELVKKHNLNSAKVFVAGLSAGGAMTSNLLGCYSDIFVGGAIHSGLEFAAAQTEEDAHKVTKNAPTRDLEASVTEARNCSPKRSRLMPLMIFHGDKDPYVNPLNAERISTFIEKFNTRIFLENGHDLKEITKSQSQITQPDPHKFTGDSTDISFGSEVIVRKINIIGMRHGWSGGQPTAPYMEPRGVDASKIISEFFFQ